MGISYSHAVKLTQCNNPWECTHPEQAQISQMEDEVLPACNSNEHTLST